MVNWTDWLNHERFQEMANEIVYYDQAENMLFLSKLLFQTQALYFVDNESVKKKDWRHDGDFFTSLVLWTRFNVFISTRHQSYS